MLTAPFPLSSDDATPATLSETAIRYASPELIARAESENEPATLEEDIASDVYSFGVVCWEMYTRRAPWANCTTQQIIKASAALDLLQLPEEVENDDNMDGMRIVVRSIIQSTMIENAGRRPNMNTIATKLNGFE